MALEAQVSIAAFQQVIIPPLVPTGEAAAELSVRCYRVLPEGSRLALPRLSNKQLNHSLLAINISSWSLLVNLCKENLISIKFWLRLGLSEQVEAQLSGPISSRVL